MSAVGPSESSVVGERGHPDGTVPSVLERRYQRWMGLFPTEYRVVREDELIGVLPWPASWATPSHPSKPPKAAS